MNNNVIFLDYQPKKDVEPTVNNYINEVNLAVKQQITTAYLLLSKLFEDKEAGEPIHYDDWTPPLGTIWTALERWEKIDKSFFPAGRQTRPAGGKTK